MKTCNKCGETKEFSEFWKDSSKKDGFAGVCIACQKERNRIFSESPLMQLKKAVTSSVRIENKILFKEGKKLCSSCKNIFLINEIKMSYCEPCREEYSKKYKKHNKEKINERKSEYYKDNKEKINERASEYYKDNKEIVRETRKQYREENREKINERKRRYREKNREKINEYHRQRYLKLKEGN